LLRDGKQAMLLQAGFAADLRVMALNADSDFLASGGKYLGVRSGAGKGDVWKLKVCTSVDSLLVIACMLANILAHTATPPEPEPEIAEKAESVPSELSADTETQPQQPVESCEEGCSRHYIGDV